MKRKYLELISSWDKLTPARFWGIKLGKFAYQCTTQYPKLDPIVFTVVFIACTFIGILTSSILGQTGQNEKTNLPDSVLERSVLGADLELLTTREAFFKALNLAEVPGGYIRVEGCESEQVAQTWRPAGSPLREVLDSIVREDPGYHWDLEDGVINLIPIDGEPALLKVRITELNVENVITADMALDQLLALPEVKKRMAELNLRRGMQLLIIPSSPRMPKFSVHCQDVTLREALNAIARAQGRAMWRYIEPRCNGRNEVTIQF